MEIEVNKIALYSLLEKLVENRTPSNDNMNKFAFEEDELIQPVDMMSTQLAQQKPDVSDPDYVPGNKVDLAVAASVIANEVPDSQIDFYYRKLHKLLDIALDRNYELGFINEMYDVEKQDELLLGENEDDDFTTDDEWAQIEDILTPTTNNVIQDITELYISIHSKVNQLKNMGLDPDEIQMYKNELGVFFDFPANDAERTMQIQQIVNYAKNDIPNLQSKIDDIAEILNVRPQAVEMTIVGKLRLDNYIVPTPEMKQLSADDDQDITAIQYANQLFDAILARLKLKRHKKQLTAEEAEAIQNDASQTMSKLIGQQQIDISSVKKLPAGQELPMIVSGDFVAQKLQAIIDDHLGRVQPEDMGIETDSIVTVDNDNIKKPRQKPQSLDDAKTFTDMASFLGFSGPSGARQWVLKHVNSKFALLLHTLDKPDEMGPGLQAYKDAYSQTLFQIIDLMTTNKAMNEFRSLYPDPQAGTAEYYAINALMQDLKVLAREADKVGNILDVKHPDAQKLNAALRTHVADAIKERHGKNMESITTYILDKASPDIILEVLQDRFPNEDIKILKKLQEHISGKSNRPNFKAEELDKTTKKFIDLGIDNKIYQQIVKEYMEELDASLFVALLTDAGARRLYPSEDKRARAKQRMPMMSKLLQKVSKKADLNKKAIFDIMEEAFLQYKDEYEKTKAHYGDDMMSESIATNLIKILKAYV
jgi:hypothetical protein